MDILNQYESPAAASPNDIVANTARRSWAIRVANDVVVRDVGDIEERSIELMRIANWILAEICS